MVSGTQSWESALVLAPPASCLLEGNFKTHQQGRGEVRLVREGSQEKVR
jgi:hypothetical protein